MNNIQIIGNIGKDAEIKTTPNGKRYISFSVATNEKVNGEKQTTWFNCTKWLQPTDNGTVANYIKKGGQIFASGKVSARVYESKAYLEVNVATIELIGSAQDSASNEHVQQPQAQQPVQQQGKPMNLEDDTLPF